MFLGREINPGVFFEIVANNSIVINSEIFIVGVMSKMQTSALS